MPKHKPTTDSLDRKANERVVGTLSSFSSEGELRGLGREVIKVIRAELVKAGFDSLDQVEDVFQSTLLEVVKRGPERARGLRPFLLRLSRAEARKYVRQNTRRQENDERVLELLKALQGEVQLPQPWEGERKLVLESLPRLPQRSRRIIELMLIEEKDDEEMRSLLGLTGGALRTAKHRALKEFRASLISGLVRSRMNKPATDAERDLWEELKAEVEKKG